MARAMFQMYTKAMNTRPWTTTILTTGTLVGLGDVAAQQFVEHKGLKKHDIRRTIKFAALGFLAIGPGLRTWYIILDKVIVGSSGLSVLGKVALDQGLWAPAFIAAFFTAVSALDGKSLPEIKKKLERDYFDALKINYFIWPAVQLGNFYFVPLRHRVVVVNIVALFWNTYLAWASQKEDEN